MWTTNGLAHKMTKNEFIGLMVRCQKHRDFFDPYDQDRNAIWYSKLPPEMTMKEAETYVDDFYSVNTKRNIMLADILEGHKKAHPKVNRKVIETAQRLEQLDQFERSISEENRARLALIKVGKAVPTIPEADNE